MGALLSSRRLAGGGGGLVLAVALSCCGDRCREEQKQLPLAAPYTGYFRSFPARPANTSLLGVAARSNSGLTESFRTVGVTGTPYPDQPPNYNCASFQAEGRFLAYAASLYGYQLSLGVVQYPEGPRLVVTDQSRDNPGATRFHFRFDTGRASEIEYRDPSSGYVFSGLTPEVRELPSLTVNSRTYAPVWRLTNPYLTQQGRPTAATVLFLSPDYGLVRFEQRDGTVWDLTP